MVTKVTPFSPRDFRNALSCFATGVTVVTARDSRWEPVGMTASSFNSVSVDPPLILWSVTKTARSAIAFKSAERFAVHVLAMDQTDLSNTFAKTGGDKFAGVTFADDSDGVPILPNTAARFDCQQWAVYEGGDHWIIVGEVLSFETAEREGLVFGGGTYSMAAPLAALRPDLHGGNPQDDVVGDMLQYQLSQAYHRMVVQFHDVVRSHGLSVDEWRIATVLFGPEPVSLTDLAGTTYLEPVTLSDILAGLESRGFCSRQTIDGQSMVNSTELGRDSVRHLVGLAQQQEEAALAPLSEEQRAALKAGLRAFVGARGED